MVDFILYNTPQSTCSQRVRFTLNAKKIEFKQILLDLFSGDQLKPEYLSINPNGVVPALKHKDDIIIDSSVIIEYLEDILPDNKPMRPTDPVRIAEMRTMIRFIDEVPGPAVRIPTYNLAFLQHFKDMTEEEFLALADSKPLRREFLLKMGRTGFSKEDMDEALGRLKRTIVRMDEWINSNNGDFMMGDQLTYADISVMPLIIRMEDINLSNYWDDYSSIGRWLDRIKNHGAFKDTYYKGSLLSEKYPHLKFDN